MAKIGWRLLSQSPAAESGACDRRVGAEAGLLVLHPSYCLAVMQIFKGLDQDPPGHPF